MPNHLAALDIETKCAVPTCEDKHCKHALIPHQAKITIVGIYSPEFQKTFENLADLKHFVDQHPELEFVAHNGKFDFKHLNYSGVAIANRWVHDTQLMAATAVTKIPKEYLTAYEEQRKLENKKLPKGYSHREVKGHSLKTLAPYFLGVPAFWEDPSNHHSVDYVLKDCKYTYELYLVLSDLLKSEGTYDFYHEKLLPATQMLLTAECRGIRIDLKLLQELEISTDRTITDVKTKLDMLWAPAYEAYKEKVRRDLQNGYLRKQAEAYEKAKEKSHEKFDALASKYEKLFIKAQAKADVSFNMDSSTQMAWLLRDYFNLDIEREVRDKVTNTREIKDSTGIETLQRLYNQTEREDLKLLLAYREKQKLMTSFFEPYKAIHDQGVIRATLNSTGTRTGRLSSSDPNLQQVPGDLHQIFIARPGYKIASFDEAAIEARLLAYYSEDPVLFDLVLKGQDIHGFHTCLFFGLDCDPSEVKAKYKAKRDTTKNIGFALYYGAGYRRIQQEAMSSGYAWSDEDCIQKLKSFKKTYKAIFDFKKKIDIIAEHEPMTNLFGRKVFFSNPEDIYMQNLNTLIQSSASDLVFFSATRIQKEFKDKGIDAHVLLLVHDEIVTEIPEDREDECLEIIKRNMTDYELDTRLGRMPLAVEGKVANHWAK